MNQVKHHFDKPAEKKPIWKSKTFWINLIPIVLRVLEGVGVLPAGQLDPITSPEMLAFASTNLGLRVVTSKPVTIT